jgi:hypothetical protein
MTKTRISMAVLALAIGSAAPLFTQGANDDPSREPPAGGRIPAAGDTPQHSGDTARDRPSGPDATSQQPGQRSQQERWQTHEQLSGDSGAQLMDWGQEGRTSPYPQLEGGTQGDYDDGDWVGGSVK